MRIPVCTPVCTPDFLNAYISAKNEDNASKLSGYDPWPLQGTSKTTWMIHCAIPLFVPLFVLLFVPLIFQMLILNPKMKIMPGNFQDMILVVYKVHQESHG